MPSKMKNNLRAQELQVTMLGLLLITSSGIITESGMPLNALTPQNGIQAGQTFVSVVVGPTSSSYGVAGQAASTTIPGPLQTILASQSQAGENFIFVRQGETYAVFPQSSDESLQSPLLAQMTQIWNDSHRKRSRFRTHVEILELLKSGPLSAFEVAFQLRLNSKRTREYLEFLEQNGLVELGQREKTLYRITPSGMTLVERARTFLFLDN
jgi:predicted transcriptional regulator